MPPSMASERNIDTQGMFSLIVCKSTKSESSAGMRKALTHRDHAWGHVSWEMIFLIRDIDRG